MKRYANQKASLRNAPGDRRVSPPLLIALVVAAVLLLLTVARYQRRDAGSVDATVTLESQEFEEAAKDATRPPAATFPDKGEGYRTADRLREAASLAFVASLYVVEQEVRGRRPASAQSILTSLAARSLYPPGVYYDDVPGWLRSDLAHVQLRYRNEPSGIEVLSYGDSEINGPALIVRVPGDGVHGDRGVLFIANKLGRIDAPPPFASPPDLAEAGWIEHPLHNTDMTDRQKRDIANWLASIRSRKER